MATDVQKDAWAEEFLALEMELSALELFLLLRVVGAGEDDPWAPVWFLALDQWRGADINQAPFLSEGCLLEMARQQRLIRWGLLRLLECQDGATILAATEKGVEAARWCTGALVEAGFEHPTIKAL